MIRYSPPAPEAPTMTRAERAWQSARSLPAAWCAVGFLAGAIFWHLVGFWGFVSDAVFRGGVSNTSEIAAAEPGTTQKTTRRLVVSTKQASCAMLALDRITGETTAGPCPADIWHHRYVGVGKTQDREPPATAKSPSEHPGTGVAGWATNVEDLGADLTIR
jgi:hypothetical protein